jgi:hypothetical protein
MATIIIRNSTGSGAVPSSLVQGELAINTVDGKLFYGSGSGNVVKEFTGSAGGGSTNTGSLLTTASFSNPNLTFTKGDGSTFNTSLISLVPTSASYALTASFVATASWATNAITASIAGTAVSADTAKAVLTVANATNADFYPTFVDSNNSPTAASEIVYTSNRITFNPSAQLLTVPRIFSTTITASTFTGSLTGSLLGTASYAVQALSASWAPGGGSAFPYIGTAVITGSLIVSGANGGINTSLGFPVLFQNDGVNTVVFGNGKLWLNDSVGGTSVDWGNRYLLDTSGTTKADWEQSYLADGAAITRVDWGNGALNDSAGTTAFDWESRRMIDVAGARSADFDTRFLIYPNGTTAAINYGTQGQIAMTGSVSITGSLTVSGSSTFTNIGPAVFTGSVSSLNGFTGSLLGTASYATVAQTLLGSVTSASFASTASFVNTLNQNVIITSGLAIGTSSLGSTENALVVGLPPAGGVGEGGQILLQASGGLYTTASMIDNYQNKFRILRGTNASSDAFKFQVDMHSGQVQMPNYNSKTAFTGSAVATLGADSNGTLITISPILSIQDVTDGTAVTGTTSGTLTKSILIPANTVGVGDVLYIKSRARKTGTAGTLVVRMYINTSAAIGGSLIATSATNAASTVYFQYARTAVVKSTTNTETMAGNGNINADDNVAFSSAVSANNINWTVDQYLVIVHTNASAADSSVNSFGHIQINKA